MGMPNPCFKSDLLKPGRSGTGNLIAAGELGNDHDDLFRMFINWGQAG